MKIGILTFHWADNYGAVLQAYALSKWLKYNSNSNDTVEIVNYINQKGYRIYKPFVFRDHTFKTIIKSIIKGIILLPSWYKKRQGFNNFRKLLPISKKCDRNNLYNSEVKYDIWITGSDQVWNTDIIGDDYDIYDLSFVNNQCRCSYAASADCFDIEHNIMQRQLVDDISKIDYISVREKSIFNFLNKEINKPVSRVLDPTFLLEKKEWEKISSDIKPINSKYVFVYFISFDNQLLDCVIKTADKYNLSIIVCGHIKDLEGKAKQYNSLSPEEFLRFIRYADFVVASSFHAVAFSIIFEKQFISIVPPYASNRVTDLCKVFSLENHVVSNDQLFEIDSIDEIDYCKVKTILKKERDMSINFLKIIINSNR